MVCLGFSMKSTDAGLKWTMISTQWTCSPMLVGFFGRITGTKHWRICCLFSNSTPKETTIHLGLSTLRPNRDWAGEIFKRLSTILNGKLIHRRVITTEAGFVGIGARNIRRGDIITFLFDTVLPVVLRPCDGHYKIVGCAYVSGFMEVEWLDFYIYTGQLEGKQFRIY